MASWSRSHLEGALVLVSVDCPVEGGAGVTFEASVSAMVGWSSEEFWAGAKHVVLVSLMESEKKCPHQHQAS